MIIELAVVLFTILMVSLLHIHRVRERHHGYWGAMLVAAALILHWPLWLAWLGLVLLADDAVQHFIQAATLVPRMADFTPIHRIGAWLVAFDWKRAGWWAPLGIAALLAACAIFAALHWGA